VLSVLSFFLSFSPNRDTVIFSTVLFSEKYDTSYSIAPILRKLTGTQRLYNLSHVIFPIVYLTSRVKLGCQGSIVLVTAVTTRKNALISIYSLQ
jgi:hypothetical protein